LADFDEQDAVGLQMVAGLVSRLFTQPGRS